jgi:hypothetical protein
MFDRVDLTTRVRILSVFFISISELAVSWATASGRPTGEYINHSAKGDAPDQAQMASLEFRLSNSWCCPHHIATVDILFHPCWFGRDLYYRSTDLLAPIVLCLQLLYRFTGAWDSCAYDLRLM